MEKHVEMVAHKQALQLSYIYLLSKTKLATSTTTIYIAET